MSKAKAVKKQVKQPAPGGCVSGPAKEKLPVPEVIPYMPGRCCK